MNSEAWIWTELLAFDNTLPDLGVGEYLERLDFMPKGISLMASASDFIMLHEDLSEERVLFPDICARFGQAGNEERTRQEWTNLQLRDLVRRLKAAGVEVFVSVFAAYHHDRFHKEWLSDHPEARVVYSHLGVTDGVQMLARLADGTFYEDIFAQKLGQVLDDYNFDGFHGPDHLGPGGNLHFSDCSDGMAAQFGEYLGEDCPPELVREVGWDREALAKRMELLCERFYPQWLEFNMLRWEQFWTKIVCTVKARGKRTMINSANTKAAFEGMFIYGMDYRRIARLGVDYLVVETVAANLALIDGGYERHFDFAATLAEMKAFVPEMKLLFLHGVKDVCESYDLLHHAPSRLEREVYTLANQYMVGPDGALKRCASGFMVCLGDGLSSTEWSYLRRQWQTAFSFEPVRAGELTWVWSEAAVDRLMDDYRQRGTWPGFKQAAHLTEAQALQVHCICRTEHLAQVQGPLVVPNADLLAPWEKEALDAYTGGPVVLFERAGVDGAVTCVISEGGRRTVAAEAAKVTPWRPDDAWPPLGFSLRPNYESIAELFWAKAAEAVREAICRWEHSAGIVNCRPQNPEEGLRLMTSENARGTLQVALISTIETYLIPQMEFTRTPVEVDKKSSFPYTPLVIVEGKIRSGHNLTPLHIPPYGIIVMDVAVCSHDDAGV